MNYADVFWATLPEQGGREQMGRRPVIIFQDTVAFVTPTVLVIPLTSQLDTLNIPATLLIQPTASNGLRVPSVALVFQLRAIDVRGIEQYVGHLDDPDLQAIQALAKRLMKLP